MNQRVFEKLVERALQELPSLISERIENVGVVVEDWPSPVVLEEAGLDNPYDLLGFYQGTPLTDRIDYGMVLPDKISIFRMPIEAVCSTEAEVMEEVRRTVVHEVAHHLGFSDGDLARLHYD